MKTPALPPSTAPRRPGKKTGRAATSGAIALKATEAAEAQSTATTAAARVLVDPRWAALCTRDPAAEGQFVYAVRSTGIYCRPTCPSRRPRPENVAFYADPVAARAAGFRPCLRCHPDQPPLAQRQADLVAGLCRFIASADTLPTLDELAARAGLSPHHLHRLFQTHTGLTPRAYARAHRAERLRSGLGQGVEISAVTGHDCPGSRPADNSPTITDALYAAGYNASSRFYAEADQVLGMAPRRFRAGGVAEEIRFAIAATSLGALLVARSSRGLCAILLGDDPAALAADLQQRFPQARLLGDGPQQPDFEAWVAQVVGLVEQPRQGLALPLDLRGTVFQHRVWQALQAIPPGETRSYTEIAQALGLPKAVRAVAAACAANPLAVAVPCHRVVRSDGGLAGYRWGLERKARLQQREKEQGGESVTRGVAKEVTNGVNALAKQETAVLHQHEIARPTGTENQLKGNTSPGKHGP